MGVEIVKVAGSYNGATGGVAWDGARVLFSAVAESRIMAYDPESGDVSQVRRFTNRVNGIAFGPSGEFFGAQEGSRRVIEFLADGSSRPTQSRLNGEFHNFPTDLVVDSRGRIKVERKEDMRRRGLASPDRADAASQQRAADNDCGNGKKLPADTLDRLAGAELRGQDHTGKPGKPAASEVHEELDPVGRQKRFQRLDRRVMAA